MRLFGTLLNKTDINAGLEKFSKTPGALLLDVRTEEEYRERHIKGSVNIPLDRLSGVGELIPDKDREIFVYCHSGGRSRSAAGWLAASGYRNVSDIGGIVDYRGDASPMIAGL